MQIFDLLHESVHFNHIKRAKYLYKFGKYIQLFVHLLVFPCSSPEKSQQYNQKWLDCPHKRRWGFFMPPKTETWITRRVPAMFACLLCRANTGQTTPRLNTPSALKLTNTEKVR